MEKKRNHILYIYIYIYIYILYIIIQLRKLFIILLLVQGTFCTKFLHYLSKYLLILIT